jgi:hypothetical protein
VQIRWQQKGMVLMIRAVEQLSENTVMLVDEETKKKREGKTYC